MLSANAHSKHSLCQPLKAVDDEVVAALDAKGHKEALPVFLSHATTPEEVGAGLDSTEAAGWGKWQMGRGYLTHQLGASSNLLPGINFSICFIYSLSLQGA